MAGSPSSDGILSSVKEALYEAVVIEQVEMVSVLLEAASACGTHVNELYYDADKVTYTVRRTLLGCAAEHNHVRAVKRLLQEKGMKVDAKDSQGRTPLNLASCNGHAETVKVLLEAGADTTLQYDHDGLSSEEVKGAIDAVDEQIRQLSEACSSGRVEEVATMLASHPQLVNGRRADQRRQTVLMLAAGAGQGDVVRLLLEKGADAKLVHNGRQTALMLAAAGGHVEVAAMLLDAAGGCEIDAADNLHRTAFCRACEGGHVEVVKLLLEKGARHEVSGAEDEDDWSFRHEPFRHECRPLVVASQIGNLALVNLLLELPWEGSTTDASLREASQHLHVEVVTALLHKLERVSVKSFASALREAARQGSMELFTALVTNVASDMDAMKMCLSIAVHAAYDEGQVEMMEALLRAGAAIDPYLLERFEEQYGVPVQSLEDLLAAREHLVETVREGHLQAASQLMEEYGRQALMNTAVPGGSWPLVAAIEAGREESVQWLMENGAWLSETKYPWVQRAEQAHADRLCEVGDEEHIERQCGTAELCLACEHGHLGIVKYLIEEKGADPRGEGPFGSPLALAAEGGYLLVVQHLLQIGKQSVDGLNQALKAACREGYRRCALLLLRAGLEREYVLAKACSIHAAATVVPPCLTARAAEGLVPLPSVEVAAPAQAEGGGQGGQGKKRGRENERGGWSLEVVCEVARFVGEALKADLQMELMEMLMPGEEEATRLVEAARQEEAATDDEDSMDDA